MKKHLSVLGLWARLNLYRTAALLVLMAVFEAALFGGRLLGSAGEPPVLEDALWGVPIISAVTFLTVFALLCAAPGEKGYTLGRLQISEEASVLWRAACNSLCLLAFWAAQTAVALALCRWYAASLPPEYRSGQTVFLAFYQVKFLHSLLPLEDWIIYLRNLLMALVLGFGAAVQSYRYRRSHKYRPTFTAALAGAMVVLFPQEMGDYGPTGDLLLLALAALVRDIRYLAKGWGGTLDEE